MGEIADKIVQGKVCCYCNTRLQPGEKVYSQHDNKPTYMPLKGDGRGFPVYCKLCKD